MTTARISPDTDGALVPYMSMPGSPYTGSTLLGFLLNSHPSCVSIGAATGLTSKVQVATYQCSCGELFTECEFWRRVADRTVELGHPVTVYQQNFWNTHVRVASNRRLNTLLVRSLGNGTLNRLRDAATTRSSSINRMVDEFVSASWTLSRAVLDLSGATVFVDTARDHQRPRFLSRHPLIDLKVLHLVRDPRGNIASIMNHTGVDVRRAARQWKRYNVEADRARGAVPKHSSMILRYDELCADTRGALNRLHTFLGVESWRSLGDFRDAEHHIIGNSMRVGPPRPISEDLSWQSRLSDSDLEVIADEVGAVSHRWGFDWP